MKPHYIAVTLTLLFFSSPAADAASPWGLKPGPVELQSAGPIAFGPDGVLIVGDAKAAAVYAIDTEDHAKAGKDVSLNVSGLSASITEKLRAKSLSIVDMAGNPLSKNIYLSTLFDGRPSIIRVLTAGEIERVGLDKVQHARVEIEGAPDDKVVGQGRRRRNLRGESITDIAYSDGRVLVSGLSKGDAPSAVREFDFPFSENSRATSVEIYHGAHGRFETYAAIRTFVPFNIDGKPSLLAGFTCTPLVKFPLDALSGGGTVRGTTVAELGNRNRPLDMIVYQKDGKDYLLMANSSRGVMKISTADIERENGITERVSGGGVAGQEYETIDSLKGVVQLDQFDAQHAAVLVKMDDKDVLKVIDLP